MPQEIYKIIENRATSKYKHVTCEDEEGELQDLLESNLDLIPGDQINNDDPPQWLLVKRGNAGPGPIKRRSSLEHRLLSNRSACLSDIR